MTDSRDFKKEYDAFLKKVPYQTTVVDNIKVRYQHGGKEGAPGELTGGFMNNEIQLGEIDRNTDCGVFGLGESGLGEGGLYPDGLPVASRDEIHAGKAEILSCVDGKEVRAYEGEIERVNASPERHTRTM